MSNWGAQIHKSHKRKTSNLEKSRSRNQSRLPIRMVVTPSKKNLFQSRLQWRWLWEWSSTLYDGDLHSMTQEDHSSKTRTSWDDIMIPVVFFFVVAHHRKIHGNSNTSFAGLCEFSCDFTSRYLNTYIHIYTVDICMAFLYIRPIRSEQNCWNHRKWWVQSGNLPKITSGLGV